MVVVERKNKSILMIDGTERVAHNNDSKCRQAPYGGHHGIFPFFLDAYQSFLAQRYLVLKLVGRTTEISEKSFNNMPPVNGHMPNGSIDSACST